MGQTITMAAFRRTILAIAAVLTMAASMVALAGPAFAKVTRESECVGGYERSRRRWSRLLLEHHNAKWQ